jgi:hypothetical protein
MVHLVIASGSSHINGTTITPMSNQDSTAAKAEGSYTIEIIENNNILGSSQSITTVVLSLLGIGITTNKMKRRKNIER